MDWQDVARSQAGVIAREQLLRSGVTEASTQTMIALQELVPLQCGVYQHRSGKPTQLQRMWAASLWSGGGVISHRSAAALWRLPVDEHPQVHVTVDDRRYRLRAAGVTLHRVPLSRVETCRFDGLPVTTRSRTLVDLLRTEPIQRGRGLLDRAVQLGWVSAEDLRRSLRDGPGRTGNTRLRELLAGLEPGADAESERVLHRLLRRAGISGWRKQHTVRLRHRTVYLDVAFPKLTLGIEVDGKLAHDELSDRFEDDRSRQNELVAAGWTILRFTWRQLHDRPNWVLAQIVQFLPA